MSRRRKRYGAEFKAKAAMQALPNEMQTIHVSGENVARQLISLPLKARSASRSHLPQAPQATAGNCKNTEGIDKNGSEADRS